eukprot:TRINITY_DN45373_c0_g1_i1.p1 TRINITY_DN45373_c0_g1~~TRINITY_DN45373_c0_g1_i1.p1  ORF type:complete len:103 (+),score=14.53 TRINITY_DN45373_c0_g1_i1:222-530(+)
MLHPSEPNPTQAGNVDTASMLRNLLNAVGGSGSLPSLAPPPTGGNPFDSVKGGSMPALNPAPTGMASERKPWNYKTKACMYFMKDGRCRNCLLYTSPSPRDS